MVIDEKIRRLLRYRICLEKFKKFGLETAYSYTLGKESGVSAEQVRKDFSCFKISGHKKGGYNIIELLDTINHIFSKDKVQHIVIIGLGNIGEALIKYKGFDKHNIRIAGVFDINPVKLKKNYNIPVYSMDMLKDIIDKYNIKIGVIAVPAIAAQEVCYDLVECGITGIMNFSPVILRSPNNVNIYNIELIPVLEALRYHSIK